jgi:hypothetical protein
MDIADMAQPQVELDIEAGRYAASLFKPPVATGFCLNCDDFIAASRALNASFCETDCRVQYERRAAAIIREGVSRFS